jgi:hypothetical protein
MGRGASRFGPAELLSDRPILGTVPPVTTKVRVPGNALALGGWRGQMEILGDVVRVVGEDRTNRLEIDCAQVKRCSFNSNNGLWAFRMKDGKKLYLQTSGLILSADRSGAGRAATESIAGLLAKHGVRGFSV